METTLLYETTLHNPARSGAEAEFWHISSRTQDFPPDEASEERKIELGNGVHHYKYLEKTRQREEK